MIREAERGDLHRLLLLYTHLHGNEMPPEDDALSHLWNRILGNENYHIVVAEETGALVSSCVVLIVPNLTHSQRPYAVVENVVTHPAHRGHGFASACLAYAKIVAQRERCYKIMLMTGTRQESTLRFYEKAGYNQNDKTAFIQWL